MSVSARGPSACAGARAGGVWRGRGLGRSLGKGGGERLRVPGNTAQANVSGLSQKPRGPRNALGWKAGSRDY